MSKQTKYNKSRSEYNICNSEGSQLIVLGAIISSIIYQEVQNDDDLNTIGNLLIAIGSNLVLGVGQRAACDSNLNKANNENVPSEPDTNIPSRSQSNSSNKNKKVKKRKKLKEPRTQIE